MIKYFLSYINTLMAKKIYLFVYGSLMNKLSREKTIGRNVPSFRTKLKKEFGYTCDWCFRSERCKMTALGLYKKKSKTDINGEILELEESDFKSLDKREEGYDKIKINRKYFDKIINQDIKLVYSYVVKEPLFPNENYPIRSYYKKLCNIK